MFGLAWRSPGFRLSSKLLRASNTVSSRQCPKPRDSRKRSVWFCGRNRLENPWRSTYGQEGRGSLRARAAAPAAVPKSRANTSINTAIKSAARRGGVPWRTVNPQRRTISNNAQTIPAGRVHRGRCGSTEARSATEGGTPRILSNGTKANPMQMANPANVV